jgi:hypothetical protein
MKIWNGKVFPTICEHISYGKYTVICKFSNSEGMVFAVHDMPETQSYVSVKHFWDHHAHHEFKFKVIPDPTPINYKDLNDELTNKVIEQEQQIYNYVEDAKKAQNLAVVNNAHIKILRMRLERKDSE